MGLRLPRAVTGRSASPYTEKNLIRFSQAIAGTIFVVSVRCYVRNRRLAIVAALRTMGNSQMRGQMTQQAATVIRITNEDRHK